MRRGSVIQPGKGRGNVPLPPASFLSSASLPLCVSASFPPFRHPYPFAPLRLCEPPILRLSPLRLCEPPFRHPYPFAPLRLCELPPFGIPPPLRLCASASPPFRRRSSFAPPTPRKSPLRRFTARLECIHPLLFTHFSLQVDFDWAGKKAAERTIFSAGKDFSGALARPFHLKKTPSAAKRAFLRRFRLPPQQV